MSKLGEVKLLPLFLQVNFAARKQPVTMKIAVLSCTSN